MGVVRRGNHHIARFAWAKAELIDRYRLNVLSVNLNHLHLHAGNTDVIESVASPVDETQPYSLASGEQPRPVARRRYAIHQVGQCCAGEISQIRRVHPHLVPHPPLVHGRCPSFTRNVAKEVDHSRLVIVVVVALDLKLGEDAHRILVRPVGKQDGVIAIGPHAVLASGIDNDTAI